VRNNSDICLEKHNKREEPHAVVASVQARIRTLQFPSTNRQLPLDKIAILVSFLNV
jgi:hypothetical protein